MLSAKCVHKLYIYLMYMKKEGLSLNNLLWLICHKTTPNQIGKHFIFSYNTNVLRANVFIKFTIILNSPTLHTWLQYQIFKSQCIDKVCNHLKQVNTSNLIAITFIPSQYMNKVHNHFKQLYLVAISTF